VERLRTPFFIVALVASGLVVLLELGSTWLVGGALSLADSAVSAADLGVEVPAGTSVQEPTGLALRYLALVDVIPLLTVGLMGAGLLLPDRISGRAQSVVTLIASVVLILTAIVLLIVAIAALIFMVTLLLAFPFGTIAYLIIFGDFPRGQAAAVLSVLMFLKLVFAGSLVAAQPRFLQNKGLVALVLTSLVANLLVAFLHAFMPIIFVSILDAIAAIVLAIIAIIWGIVLLIGSIVGIVTAIRATVSSARDIDPSVVTGALGRRPGWTP
jgi:hypothetical protein